MAGVQGYATAHPELLDPLTWIPYWDPDEDTLRDLREAGGEYAYVPMSKEKHRYMLQDVRRQVQRRNLTVRWPLDSGVRWDVAHVGYFAAADRGRGIDFIDRVFNARWREGASIDDPAVVCNIATGLGLDGHAVSSAHRDPYYRAKGVEALLSAYDDDVFGPPLFVIGREKYWGMDRLDEFAGALRKSVRAPADTVTTTEGDGVSGVRSVFQPVGADISHAGGCG